jgi:hypothetical protein
VAVALNHDLSGAAWTDSHAKLGDAVASFFAATARARVGGALERINAYQYHAPWGRRTHRAKLPVAK